MVPTKRPSPVDGQNPLSIKQHMWSSNIMQTTAAPQLNLASCLACVMQDFGHSTFEQGERKHIHGFVLPVVQDFAHQPYVFA